MIHSTRIPDDCVSAAGGKQDADQLLSRYFQAALPEHWPACPQPGVNQAESKSSRFSGILSYRRLAVVAATITLIVGYQAMFGSMPDSTSSVGSQVDSSQPFGMRLLPGKVMDQKSDDKPGVVDVEKDPKKVELKK